MVSLETRPQTVAILGLGPSLKEYVTATCKAYQPLAVDEIWGVNMIVNAFQCDKVFVMDDLRTIQRRSPDFGARLKITDIPIVTCAAYPEFPTSVAYPLDEVSNFLKDDPFTTTIAYQIAYAIYIDVKELYLFGCDFFYPGSDVVENGAQACAYLLGIARERGMNTKIPKSSTLLDSHLCEFNKEGKRRRKLYGYDYNPGDSRQRVRDGVASELDKTVEGQVPKITADGGMEEARP